MMTRLRGRVLAALARVKRKRKKAILSISTVPAASGENAIVSHDPEHDYGEYFCPGCEPERDQMQGMNTIRWCGPHTPTTKGPEGSEFEYLAPMGQLEAGGEDNARMCQLIHRGKVST